MKIHFITFYYSLQNEIFSSSMKMAAKTQESSDSLYFFESDFCLSIQI